MKKIRLHREKWVEEADAVIKNMSGVDVSYFSDFIWCGNQVVDVWFYPDGTCHFSVNGDTMQKIRTKDAEAVLVEQPPEELFAAGGQK